VLVFCYFLSLVDDRLLLLCRQSSWLCSVMYCCASSYLVVLVASSTVTLGVVIGVATPRSSPLPVMAAPRPRSPSPAGPAPPAKRQRLVHLNDFTCLLCDVRCNDSTSLARHVSSAQHRHRLLNCNVREAAAASPAPAPAVRFDPSIAYVQLHGQQEECSGDRGEQFLRERWTALLHAVEDCYELLERGGCGRDGEECRYAYAFVG